MFDRIRHQVRSSLLRLADEVADRHYARTEALVEKVRADLENHVRHETDRLIRAVHDVEFRSRRDLFAAGERAAAESTERFLREHLPTAPIFTTPLETLEYALSQVSGEGMVLEFGVFSGNTLKVISAACQGREVYGFDSFDGLPEDWRTTQPAGTFAVHQVPEVDGAEMVVGLFADTLPGFLAAHPGPVAFLHLDADLYSSTKTVLDLAGDRLRPGSIVLFDEYFNYTSWESHEHRAWTEFVERTGIGFDYVGYTVNNEQLIVRITGCADRY
ncbi:MAG TPA: class I SAM-dependent methyltransferase [Amycolatopsis sp.]|nr:class I SAM-dependent methyltransferase [Amycolatopsis sp.]